MWGWVSAAAVAGAMLVGLPLLMRGFLGGRRGHAAAMRRGERRAARRYRAGPGLGGLALLGLARRLDGVVLAVATGAVVVLAVLNAKS